MQTLAAHPSAPTPVDQDRVAHGLAILGRLAQREGWTRAQKRRAVAAFHMAVQIVQEAEAAS